MTRIDPTRIRGAHSSTRRVRRPLSGALAAVYIAAFTCVSLAGAARTPGTAPCGTRVGQKVAVTHVIWIWFENHSLDEIVGAPGAPNLTAVAQACGLATGYHGVAHPSLPNYIAATSGDTHGITDDGPPSAHPLTGPSIFAQARSARGYEESMPGTCALQSTSLYFARHNPETYYVPLRAQCRRYDVPLGTPAQGNLATALDQGSLPAFSFVAPNVCNDMHNCSVAIGDAWFKPWITKITASPEYRAGTVAVFVVWDEDDHSSGNTVPLIVVSPYTPPGTRVATPFTHYSLLRTTEELLGIRAHLGHAATAAGMRTAFGL